MFAGVPTDGWTALLTLALAVSTGLLWWETRQLAGHAERQARETNRPVPIVQFDYHDGALWASDGPRVDIQLKNAGQQPGYLSNFWCAATCAPSGSSPPLPTALKTFDMDGRREKMLRGLLIMEQGQERRLQYHSTKAFEPDTAKRFRDRDCEVFFFGLIDFSDASGNLREAGFCFRLMPRSEKTGEPERLIRIPDIKLNFDRPI